MKKLYCIFGLFAVMMALAVYELVATTRFYRDTLHVLTDIEQSFAAHETSLDSAENLVHVERLESQWEKGRKLILSFGNHTVVRNAEERIVALCEFARRNEYSDAMVSLRQAQRYVADLMHDLVPSFDNLF